MGSKHAESEPLREQMQQIMDQLLHTQKEAALGHSSLHDDHRNLVVPRSGLFDGGASEESHLLTSAQLQNQSEAVQDTEIDAFSTRESSVRAPTRSYYECTLYISVSNVEAELDSIMRVLSVPVVSYTKATNLPRPTGPMSGGTGTATALRSPNALLDRNAMPCYLILLDIF